MYSASQRKVGEYNNKVCLEVGAEFFGGCLEGMCRLLEMGVSGFCLG